MENTTSRSYGKNTTNDYASLPAKRCFIISRKANSGVITKAWPTQSSGLATPEAAKENAVESPGAIATDAILLHTCAKRPPTLGAPSSAKKRVKLGGILDRGRLLQATPSPAQRRWRAISSTPLSGTGTTTSPRSVIPATGRKTSKRPSNPLVELLRSRLERAEQNPGTRQQSTQYLSLEVESMDGFQTPRSMASDVRFSPPRLARNTASKSTLNTPVSAARVRIQSPAPERETKIEGILFSL